MKPIISVLIPTYNRPPLLKEAVASVLQQTFANFEVIVVNDGGEDVGEILKAFADRRIIYLPLGQNGGKARALNRAIAISRGDYFAYLDDDDRYYPHHLETLLREIEAHPEADLVYSDFDEVLYLKDEQGRRQEIQRLVKYSAEFNREALFKENYIPHPTVLHRRRVFDFSGAFDESYPCLIDWEFFHRLAFYCDFLHVRAVTGEYFINRERGDHITSLHAQRREFYMDHFFRIRRQLPPRPWSRVSSVTLLVSIRPEDRDLRRFFSKLVFSTFYPCEICVLGGNGFDLSQSGLPDAEWLGRMNITLLLDAAGENDLPAVARQASGDLLVTLDSSFAPYNGWLYPLMERYRRRSPATPLRLNYQSSPSPWGWIFDRQELLDGSKPWRSRERLELVSPADCQVSVIIPVRNKVEFTRQCLASIQRTSPTIKHEVIVVDNASDDGTAELLEKLSEKGMVTSVRNDPPLPFAASCNRGAGLAKGKYLLFLNNDTVALPGWLEELYHPISQEPDIGAVGAKLLYPDETIQHAGVAFHCFQRSNVASPYHIFRAFPRQHPAVNQVREFQVVTGACLMTPRSVFEELGGFDARYTNCYEDVDYCLNLRSRGYRVLYVPSAELIHYEGQTSGRDDAIAASRVVLQEKWGDRLKPDDHLYLPDEGFVIAENDRGVIYICEESELRQWREAVRQLFDLNEWLMALEELDRLEQIVGTYEPDLVEMRGYCALKLEDSNRARQAFNKAKLLNPREAGPSWGLAQVAVAQQRFLEAKSRLRRLIADFPRDARQQIWRETLEDISAQALNMPPDLDAQVSVEAIH